MKKLTIWIAILSYLFGCSSSYAQWVVFDPSNFAKNAVTMLETIQQRIMQAKQLRIEVETHLRNFTELDFSIGNDLNSDLRDLFREVGTIQGLMQDLHSLDSRFQELYPDIHKEHFQGATQLRVMSDDWLDESKEMMRGAAHVGAQILDNMPRNQQQIDQVLSDSQAAVGILQVSQAGNQMLAKVAGSLSELNAQLATYHQAHMTYLLKQNQEEAAHKNWEKHYFTDKPGSSSTSFKLSGKNYTSRN